MTINPEKVKIGDEFELNPEIRLVAVSAREREENAESKEETSDSGVKKFDPVQNPAHYCSGGIECIDAISSSMTEESFKGFLKGNVQKYLWRYEKKANPPEDLKKAKWYLERLIKESENDKK